MFQQQIDARIIFAFLGKTTGVMCEVGICILQKLGIENALAMITCLIESVSNIVINSVSLSRSTVRLLKAFHSFR